MMDPELDADNDLLKKEQDAQVCNISNQPFKSSVVGLRERMICNLTSGQYLGRSLIHITSVDISPRP